MSERTYTAIASASWARLFYVLEALRVLVRQRIALGLLVTYVLLAEIHHEARLLLGGPRGRHAAPRRTVRSLIRLAS